MDSFWNSASFSPGTLECFLCRDTLDYVDGDRTNFINHLKNIHMVKFHHNFMLAITFFDNLNSIVDQFETTSNSPTLRNEKVESDEVLLEEYDDIVELETEKDFVKKEDASISLDVVDIKSSPIKRQVPNCEQCDKRFSIRVPLNKRTSKNNQNSEKRKSADSDTFDLSPPKVPKISVEQNGTDTDCIEYDYIITQNVDILTNLLSRNCINTQNSDILTTLLSRQCKI